MVEQERDDCRALSILRGRSGCGIELIDAEAAPNLYARADKPNLCRQLATAQWQLQPFSPPATIALFFFLALNEPLSPETSLARYLAQSERADQFARALPDPAVVAMTWRLWLRGATRNDHSRQWVLNQIVLCLFLVIALPARQPGWNIAFRLRLPSADICIYVDCSL